MAWLGANLRQDACPVENQDSLIFGFAFSAHQANAKQMQTSANTNTQWASLTHRGKDSALDEAP